MTPALYDATVAHVRRATPPKSFTHRISLWFVDLDELPRLPRWLRPFARFDTRDHFRADDQRPIRSKVDAWLAGRGVDLGGGRIVMLASARVLGHVFNPISLYWCHDADGVLACVVAEVHNTYRGRHAYLLRTGAGGFASADKEFYVSPFQSMAGEYRMSLPEPDGLLAVAVALHQGGETPLVATLRGVRRRATVLQVARMVLRRPLVPQRVSGLIRAHGIALWAKGARVSRRTAATAGGEFHG